MSKGRAILQFLGDISLNDELADPARTEELAAGFGSVRGQLGDCDLRVGNWESPLAGNGRLNPLTGPCVWTSRASAEAASRLGLDVALLANNHSYDCLEAGFSNTASFLDEYGIRWLGAGTTIEEAQAPLIIERGGLRIGIVNYVGAETSPCIPEGARVSVNLLEPPRMLFEVRRLAGSADVVVVNLHWGESFVRFPAASQRRLARASIEAGATLVIGHHAHRLQGYERWRHGAIFYCLGDFIFGSTDGRPMPPVSFKSAVAECVVRVGTVESIRCRPFVQRGLATMANDSPSRLLEQRALNRPLALGERMYRLVGHAEVLYQFGPGVVSRFVARSGGLRVAVRRVRWLHARAVTDALARQLRD